MATAVVSVEGFDGRLELCDEVPVAVAAGESLAVWSSALPPRPDHFARVESVDAAFAPNRLCFAEIKDLPRPATAPRSLIEPTSPTSVTGTLVADEFTYLARESDDHPGADQRQLSRPAPRRSPRPAPVRTA